MHKSPRLRQRLSLIIGLFLLISTFITNSDAQDRRRGAGAAGQESKVRLVVAITIDQFRFDFLRRFEDQFGEGGFRRLLKGGAVFTRANYIHVPTVTACGHATFLTGTTPAYNGIIGNEWYDRETGTRVSNVGDRNVKGLGSRDGAGGASPARLIGTTVGDEMKLASGGAAKVIGVSIKDRGAILPAGKRPDGAYWFNAATGNLISSTYYFSDLPEWVREFNRSQRPDRFFGKRWEKLLPEAAYQRSGPDDVAYEKSPLGNKFPFTITGGEEAPGPRFYSLFQATPFANDYLVDFAKAAIEAEKLGTDEVTDLLAISFSSNDILGHAYGPYSHEVHDMTLRTDRTLAELFNYLDRRIGLDRTIIVLTADHGVGPAPEQVEAMGYGGRIEAKKLLDAVETALDERFGQEKWILADVNYNVYLDESVIEKHKLSIEEVEEFAAQVLRRQPGIAECFTRSKILSGRLPKTVVAARVANGYHPQRNGNLVVVVQPFYLIGEGAVASHGTPYGYDAHVPVIFYGRGITAGEYHQDCSPADIAPTLATLLKVEPPSNAVGRVLAEALK
ncbi:MAG: alkaline phosphatase family protein [Acidobacteriota bacterium]|nr:MAG: alkaline phosphatase family protein [Acidobacteriota bacterium]